MWIKGNFHHRGYQKVPPLSVGLIFGVNTKSTYKVWFISTSTFYNQNPPPAD